METRLRYQIIGMMHVGRLSPGDRLPGIRQIARETGVDHRAVADAYRALEQDGLVEIRRGAGVYVGSGERVGGVLSETANWVASVFAEGWGRRLSRAALGDMIGRCGDSRVLCACIESNEDHMVAVSEELESDFSLQVRRVRVDPGDVLNGTGDESLDGVSFIVATVFHADLARDLATRHGVPAVVVTFNSDFAQELVQMLRIRELTVVHVDPRFAERGESYLSVTGHHERVRFASVDHLEDQRVDLESAGVLLTRAARRRLGMEEFHLIPPPPALISHASALELCRAIVKCSLAQPV